MTSKRYTDRIRGVSLFSALKDADIEAIARITFFKSYPKNNFVFQEGDTGGTLYIVLKGRVKVCLYDEEGREYVLDTIGPGGFFGEMALIDEMPRSANAVSAERTELLCLKRHDFIGLLTEKLSIMVNTLKVLAWRVSVNKRRYTIYPGTKTF